MEGSSSSSLFVHTHIEGGCAYEGFCLEGVFKPENPSQGGDPHEFTCLCCESRSENARMVIKRLKTTFQALILIHMQNKPDLLKSNVPTKPKQKSTHRSQLGRDQVYQEGQYVQNKDALGDETALTSRTPRVDLGDDRLVVLFQHTDLQLENVWKLE